MNSHQSLGPATGRHNRPTTIVGVLEAPELLYLISVGDRDQASRVMPKILRRGERSHHLELRMCIRQLVNEGYLRTFCDVVEFLPREILSHIPLLSRDVFRDAQRRAAEMGVQNIRERIEALVHERYPEAISALLTPVEVRSISGEAGESIEHVGRFLDTLRAARDDGRQFRKLMSLFSPELLCHGIRTATREGRYPWAVELIVMGSEVPLLYEAIRSHELVPELVHRILSEPVERGGITLRWMGQSFKDLPDLDRAAQDALGKGENIIRFQRYCTDGGLAAMNFAKKYGIEETGRMKPGAGR